MAGPGFVNDVTAWWPLELSNFCSSLDGIWTHTIDTLQHHSLSLTSSALDHSTTSTPCSVYLRKYMFLKIHIEQDFVMNFWDISDLPTIALWNTKSILRNICRSNPAVIIKTLDSWFYGDKYSHFPFLADVNLVRKNHFANIINHRTCSFISQNYFQNVAKYIISIKKYFPNYVSEIHLK